MENSNTNEIQTFLSSETGISSLYVILIAAGIIIAVMTAIIIGYFVIYKRRINKTLMSGEKGTGAGISPGGTALTVWLIVWVASTIFIVLQLQALSIHGMNTDKRTLGILSQSEAMYNLQEYYVNQLLEIDNSINSQNITNKYSFEFGKYNAADNTIELKITITPRLIMGDKDKYTFTAGNNSTELKLQKDGRYTGTVNIPTYVSETSGVLTLEANGEKLTQIITDKEGILQSNKWRKYYPYVDFADIDSKAKDAGSGKINVESDVTVTAFSAKEDANRRFNSLTLVFEKNGKTIREVDLMKDSGVKKQGNDYKYHFSETVSGSAEEPGIYCYIKAEDTLSYGYKLFVSGEFFMKPADNSDSEEYETGDYQGNCEITDKDGVLLKKFDESFFEDFFEE